MTEKPAFHPEKTRPDVGLSRSRPATVQILMSGISQPNKKRRIGLRQNRNTGPADLMRQSDAETPAASRDGLQTGKEQAADGSLEYTNDPLLRDDAIAQL
jgi:hypothetical protein